MSPARALLDVLQQVEDPLALLTGIFLHSPVAYQVYRADGSCLVTNPAFRRLFGSDPPPDYNVLRDDVADRLGVLDRIRRAFQGETIHVPPVWYDPRELQQVSVTEGRRVAIEATFFPLLGRDGGVEHVAIVFRDVTVERALREQAERERDLLSLVIDQSGNGIVVVDAGGKVLRFNAEAERQHGVSLRDVEPAEWARAYGLATLEGEPLSLDQTPLYRALHGEHVGYARWLVRRPDGATRILSGSASPLRAADGAPSGAVLVTRDETVPIETERRLEDAVRVAEAASRAKDEFLAMLGHELRNPLSPIVTALQLMKLKGDARFTKEQEVIERQVDHLVRLVDDLLDVSRITRGKVELKKTTLDLNDAIAQAVEMASPLLEQRRHHLQVFVPRSGMKLEGDRARLSQIASNLLTNAAKYTPPGGHVWLRAWRDGPEIVLSVKDDGIGMEPELLPNVFDLFVQGERSSDRAEGGLGIGLTLVRNLVQMHGGSVTAASDGPGRGSEFIVRLPALAAQNDVAEAQRAPNHLDPAVRARRILVVDDNVDAAVLVAELLRAAGHDVAVAHDGPGALASLERFRPDMAILDIGLPVMDGYELARRLRDSVHAPLHLIAMTGYGQDYDRVKSTEAGFDDFLVKPVVPQQLLAHIDAAE